MNASQQAHRNAEIVSARLRNLPWASIANMYDLSERRCKQVFDEYRRENPTLRHHKPVEVVDWLLDGYEGCLEELAIVSNTTAHDSSRVGAINGRMTALRQIAELLQAIGVLPHDLGQLRLQVDADVTIQRVVGVLRDFHASPEMMEAMVTALRDGDLTTSAN